MSTCNPRARPRVALSQSLSKGSPEAIGSKSRPHVETTTGTLRLVTSAVKPSYGSRRAWITSGLKLRIALRRKRTRAGSLARLSKVCTACKCEIDRTIRVRLPPSDACAIIAPCLRARLKESLGERMSGSSTTSLLTAKIVFPLATSPSRMPRECGLRKSP